MEISNLSDAEFKTLVIRMLKELSEYLNCIKKDPLRNDGNTNGNKQSVRCRVQNTGYKDAQGAEWGPQQNTKDPLRNEGYTN